MYWVQVFFWAQTNLFYVLAVFRSKVIKYAGNVPSKERMILAALLHGVEIRIPYSPQNEPNYVYWDPEPSPIMHSLSVFIAYVISAHPIGRQMEYDAINLHPQNPWLPGTYNAWNLCRSCSSMSKEKETKICGCKPAIHKWQLSREGDSKKTMSFTQVCQTHLWNGGYM